jgi:hypothetical protein
MLRQGRNLPTLKMFSEVFEDMFSCCLEGAHETHLERNQVHTGVQKLQDSSEQNRIVKSRFKISLLRMNHVIQLDSSKSTITDTSDTSNRDLKENCPVTTSKTVQFMLPATVQPSSPTSNIAECHDESKSSTVSLTEKSSVLGYFKVI